MEEEKGVRYDAKKLFLEVCRKWQALIVITLLVAVIFCVISVTSAANAEYEAKEGFVINYPEPSVGEDVLPELAEEVLNFRRTEQRELVASAGDTLANTAYINLFNAMEEAALDGKYAMEGLKENIKVELSNSNRTLTVTVIASSAKDAVFMLDNLEAQVTAEISAAGEGFSAQLTYKDAEEDLDTMYTLEEGGVMSILIAVVEGVVIGFVAAVVILLIWSAIFLRVSYAEDIAMQTDYTVLATVYPGDKGAGEACIKSALVRSKNDKVTYVTGVTKEDSVYVDVKKLAAYFCHGLSHHFIRLILARITNTLLFYFLSVILPTLPYKNNRPKYYTRLPRCCAVLNMLHEEADHCFQEYPL